MTGAELGYALEAAIAVTAVSTGVWRIWVHNRAELEERATREDRLTRAVEANTRAIAAAETATRELAAEFARYVETTRAELERMRGRLTRIEWETDSNPPPGKQHPGQP